MNDFVICLSSSELALFVGPLVVLFLFEAASCLAFISVEKKVYSQVGRRRLSMFKGLEKRLV